jgi:hypothetical protein
VACTELYTWYLLGDRDMATFKAFVLPDLTGVVVHDRYQNYECATRRWCLRMGVRDRHRRAVVATRWKLEAA